MNDCRFKNNYYLCKRHLFLKYEKVKDAVLIDIDCEEELQEFPPYCDFRLKKLDSD